MRCVASWNSQLMQGDGWADPGYRRRQWFVLNDGLVHAGAAAVACAGPKSRVARESLEASCRSVVRSFRISMESSDGYTYGHSERVARYASEIAEALALAEVEIDAVRIGAYLHDIGKIRVPYEILNKAGRLSDEEFEIIKMHPLWGLELLEGAVFPFDIRPIVRWHHEKRDGSGYPDGLAGDDIPLGPTIIGVADVFDALTSARSYRPAMSTADALREMHARRGWWRPEVYDAFRRAELMPSFRRAAGGSRGRAGPAPRRRGGTAVTV